MFETLCASLETQRAIFGAAVLGDFLLSVLVCLLMELRRARKKAQIRMTDFPPDETPKADSESDEARRVREAANEEAKAWATLQHYNAMDAYACREMEGGG